MNSVQGIQGRLYREDDFRAVIKKMNLSLLSRGVKWYSIKQGQHEKSNIYITI